MRRQLRFAALVLLVLCTGAAALQGCTPRKQQLSGQSVALSGRGAFRLNVAAPLELSASGNLRALVPADALPRPRAGFEYALFGNGASGPVTLHAHSIISEVDRYNWRWEKETWARHESVSYSTLRAGGRNWTVQVLPVTAEGDWFSALWTLNGRETPDFWLAKRWSATPEDELRLVVEYREPAPECMLEALRGAAAAAREDKNARMPSGKELARYCERPVTDFSHRADAAVSFDAAGGSFEPAGALLEARPSKQPDMGRLVGRVEDVSRGDGYDRN